MVPNAPGGGYDTTARTAAKVLEADKITDLGMEGIFKAASTILNPFPQTTLQLRVTSISLDDKGKALVDWSDSPPAQSGLTKFKKNDVIPVCGSAGALGCVPAGLLTVKGENVILSESQYSYETLLKYVIKDVLTFNEKFYLRPRRGGVVPRSVT